MYFTFRKLFNVYKGVLKVLFYLCFTSKQFLNVHYMDIPR